MNASWWDRLRRVDPRIWDGLLALVVLALGLWAFALRPHRPGEPPAVVGFGLMVVAGLAIGWRRRAPLVIAAIVTASVAAATLAVAALFNPLRRRVQRAVDRRFNRARYDAEMVIASFTARLQLTVDLDTVQGDLVDAVDAAFQPAHASVWASPER